MLRFPQKKLRAGSLCAILALLLLSSSVPAFGQYHEEPEGLPWADQPKQVDEPPATPQSASEPPTFPEVPEKVPTGPAGWLLLSLGSGYAIRRLQRDKEHSADKKTSDR
jgi:hypothetical protein